MHMNIKAPDYNSHRNASALDSHAISAAADSIRKRRHNLCPTMKLN